MHIRQLNYWFTVGLSSVAIGLIASCSVACAQNRQVNSQLAPETQQPMNSQLAPETQQPMNSQLAPETQQAMIDSINDEYHARAFYNAVIAKFGDVRPFRNIVQAENRHVQRWVMLFQQYGLPIPEDKFAAQVSAPATLREACQMGVEAEIANVKMYDKFLNFVKEPDLIDVFTQLRYVSENKHKVAFERCLQRRFLN
jgi:hypothetical protein